MENSAFLELSPYMGRPTPASQIASRHDSHTLREFYCDKHGISMDRFVDHFLSATLYPQARVFYFLAGRLVRQVDRADREIIDALGACTSPTSVRGVLGRVPFYYHPWGFFRRRLKFRVSSRRIFASVKKVKLPR